MNKIYFSIVLLMLFASCKKASVKDNDIIKYNSLTSLISVSDQKRAYTTLTFPEKASLWQIHLDKMAMANNYNPAQLDIIAEAKRLLSLAVDVNNSQFVNSDDFIIWNHKAAEVFTKEERFSLFVSLNDEVTPSLVDDGKKSCNCASQSDWCNFPAPPPEQPFYFSCDGGSNCEPKTGCGTFWSYNCDNTCAVHSIIPV